MMSLLRFIRNNLLPIFFFLLFLIKLAPFYFLPIESKFFVSHTLAKAGVVGLLGVLLIFDFKKIVGVINKNKILFSLLALFFLGQSLPVLTAEDVFLFWKGYHNIIASLIIFLTTFYLVRNKRNFLKLNKFILISGFILVGIELIFVTFADKLIPILNLVLQQEVFDAYLTNIERGRYSMDMNVELFLPFFLYALLRFKNERKLGKASVIFTVVLIAVTFFSNFRTRVVNLVFALFVSFLIFFKKQKDFLNPKNIKKLLPLGALLALPVVAAILLSSAVYSFNILDRFALKDESEDVGTLTFRINAAKKSIELFKSSPLFGVGLGNYSNYSGQSTQFEFHLLNQRNRLTYQELGSYSPHNVLFSILAEAGAFGIATFVALLVYFFWRDISYINREGGLSFPMVYIVSFWTIFVFMLFNPSHSIFVVGWFWMLRGAIEANYSVTTPRN